MSDVTHETHRRILHNLEGAKRAVLTARNWRNIPTRYQNFELAISILSGCRVSLERMRDREQITNMLRDASDRLGIWQVGRAETAVRSARLAIKETIADLEAKKPAV